MRQQLTRPNLARLLDQEEDRPDIREALGSRYSFGDLLLALLGDVVPAQAGTHAEFAPHTPYGFPPARE